MLTETRRLSSPQTRRDDALLVADRVHNIIPLPPPLETPVEIPPTHELQRTIIRDALSLRNDTENHLQKRNSSLFAHGLTHEQLLIEYTTVMMARQFALTEVALHRSGKLDFYIHAAGIELPQILIQRELSNSDPYLPYYRAQAADLYRGGNLAGLFAQDMHKVGDPHSKSRQLAGHMASSTRSEIPAISMTGAHLLTAVGIGNALNDRLKKPKSRYKRFSRPYAIAVAELGEASFGEGEVMEAISQAVKDQSALITVGYNNLGGISMGLGDTTIGDDPILFARSFERFGLHIGEASGTDIEGLAETIRQAIQYTRKEREPSLILINDLYRVTDHTSSSQQSWYTPPEELARRKQLDFLPRYRKLLENIGVASAHELDAIDNLVQKEVWEQAEEVIKRPAENPEIVYQDVYAPEFHYGPLVISESKAVPPVDHLQSTRTEGVEYTDKKRGGLILNGRQYINVVLAEEMARDPNIVVFGEDVAMATRHDLRNMRDYFRQRVVEKRENLSDFEIQKAAEALELVQSGQGYKARPEDFAVFAFIMDGKGGVFKNTQFLDFLFGQNRVFNFPIREAAIVGTAIGRTMAGQLPIVEIQFDAYTSPAFQQIHDYLSTLRWRGGGQFDAGMVIRIQGMNRVGGDGIKKAGGIGGIGHGAADISRFLVPGLRHFIPGDVEDMGAGLREAIRVARKYRDPVLVWEPINLYSDKGTYQGPNAHIPLGEAEVVRSGKDITIIAWSNNVRIAKAVAQQLGEEGIDAGVINARALGDQFDWLTVVPEIKRSGRVLIFEAGRKDGGMLAGQIQQQLFYHLDAPVLWIPAKNVPMPAGEANERFVIPQSDDVLVRARALVKE